MNASLLRVVPAPVKRAAKKAAARLLEDYIEVETCRRTGLAPIGVYDPQDIFIAGYPKSGNTWFQNLIASLIYGVATELAPDALIQELVPDVHHKRYYRRFRTPM